jgi:hypothetical protein
MLSAALKQAEVDSRKKPGDERKDLTDDDVMNIVKKEIKSRQETIVDLEKAGREISQPQAELAILNAYLPSQMDQAEVEKLAKAAIAEVGASSAKEMGNVMKVLMPRLKGRADGKLVNDVVRSLLS